MPRAAVLLALLAGACAEEARPGEAQPAGGGGEIAPAGRLPGRRDPHRPGYIGQVRARNIVDVVPDGEGKLKVVLVALGDEVAANAPLAELDDGVLRKELAVARATMRAARAARDQAEAEREEARQRLSRRKALAGNISKEELADAEFSEKKALAAYARSDAQLSEQHARIDQIEQTLAHTVIRAPFAGAVAARYQDRGAMVGPGTPIVRLISSHDLLVRFAVPADDAALPALKGKVVATVEALGVAVPGQISHISPEIDTGNVLLVEADLSIPAEWAGRIQSGLEARVVLVRADEEPANPEARP